MELKRAGSHIKKLLEVTGFLITTIVTITFQEKILPLFRIRSVASPITIKKLISKLQKLKIA